jgi:hypothetical protein
LYQHKPQCSFVGEKGIATYVLEKDKTVGKQVILFQNQPSVAVSITRNYQNGVYSGTMYTYQFLCDNPKNKIVVQGSYYGKILLLSSEGEDDAPNNPNLSLHFGRAAEQALYKSNLEKSIQKVEAGGSEEFNLVGQRGIRFGVKVDQKGIHVTQDSRSEYIGFHELDSVSVCNGVIVIKHNRYSPSKITLLHPDGLYQFPYAQLPNAGMLLPMINYFQHHFRKSAGVWAKAA